MWEQRPPASKIIKYKGIFLGNTLHLMNKKNIAKKNGLLLQCLFLWRVKDETAWLWPGNLVPIDVVHSNSHANFTSVLKRVDQIFHAHHLSRFQKVQTIIQYKNKNKRTVLAFHNTDVWIWKAGSSNIVFFWGDHALLKVAKFLIWSPSFLSGSATTRSSIELIW